MEFQRFFPTGLVWPPALNGKACLSCHKIAEKEMTIEPPSQYPVIKDLVVNFQKKKGKQKQKEEE